MSKKIKLSTGLILIFTSITLVGATSALTKGFKNWDFKEEPNIVLTEKEEIYGDDYQKLITSAPNLLKYDVSFTNEDESIKDVEEPTEDGTWIATINSKENLIYKSKELTKTFNYHTTSTEKLNKFFNVGTDSWGGTADNLSVKCSKDNVIQTMDTYTKLMIDNENETSGCLDSKYTMYDGTFKVMFKTNLSEYGAFAFWLTGVENERNTYQELTIELCSDNKAIFGSSKGINGYVEDSKTLDINYSDEYWHSLEINYNHSSLSANIKLDNEVIYTFKSSVLPSMEYVKPHIGLLYPTNPTWSGTKTNKNNYAYVANYEVYNTSGANQ